MIGRPKQKSFLELLLIRIKTAVEPGIKKYPVLSFFYGKLKLLKIYLSGKLLLFYRENLSVSFDIGTKTLKIIVAKKTINNKIEVIKQEIWPIEDFKADITGRIVDSIKKNKNLFNKEGNIKDISLIISSKDVFCGHLSLPLVEESEIKDALRWQLKDQVDFPVEGSYIWHKKVSFESERKKDKKTDVIAIIISEKLINEISDIVFFTGTYIKNILPWPLSLESFCSSLLQEKDEIAVVLDMGNDKSSLSFYGKSGLLFVRDISVSALSMTKSMVGSFTYNNKSVDLDFSTAENIKINTGIPEEDNSKIYAGIPYSQIRIMLRPEIERLCTEIIRSTDYFKMLFPDSIKKIKTIFLCGGGAKLKNIKTVLEKELPFEIKYLPVPVNVSFKNSFMEKDYLQVSGALGVFVESKNGTVVLPKKFQIEKIKRVSFSVLRVAVILLLAVFGWSFIILNLNIKHYSDRLKYYSQSAKNIERMDYMYQYIYESGQFYNKIAGKDISVYRIMKALSYIIPENAVIDDFMLEADKKNLILQGTIIAKEKNYETYLIDFKTELEKLPFFNKIEIKRIYKLSGTFQDAGFELICHLK